MVNFDAVGYDKELEESLDGRSMSEANDIIQKMHTNEDVEALCLQHLPYGVFVPLNFYLLHKSSA